MLTSILGRLLAGATAVAATFVAVPLLTPAPAARADEIRDDEWTFLSAIDVQRAWNVTRGRGVTVALLDTGVDAGQRDIAGSVNAGPDYTRGANPAGDRNFPGDPSLCVCKGYRCPGVRKLWISHANRKHRKAINYLKLLI